MQFYDASGGKMNTKKELRQAKVAYRSAPRGSEAQQAAMKKWKQIKKEEARK